MTRSARILLILTPVVAGLGATLIWWEPISAALGFAAGGAVARNVGVALEVLLVCVGVVFILRALDVFVWNGLIRRRHGDRPPKLLTDLIASLMWIAAILAIIVLVMGRSFAALITTSGVMIAVIGFSLRDLMASVFSGVGVGLEHPYRIGDWVEVEGLPTGRVVEISWLTSRLVTRDEVTVVAPNALLATRPFRNYSTPSPWFRDTILTPLPASTPLAQAQRVLTAAVRSVPLANSVAGRSPEVAPEDFTEAGVIWRVRFWVSDYAVLMDARGDVRRAILAHLRAAGIGFGYPNRQWRGGDPGGAGAASDAGSEPALTGAARALAFNDLFRTLSTEERAQLAATARERLLHAGVPVVRAGEPGSSMYVLMEGLARVEAPNGATFDIGPCGYFGEMSLLTGAPRSATVTPVCDCLAFEIDRDDLAPIFAARPDIADDLSRVVAERRAASERPRRDANARPNAEPRPQALAERLRARINHFLGFDAPAPM